MFSLELIDEMVYQAVVEILATQVSITRSGFDFENALLNSQEGDIESSSTQIEDEHISLAFRLFIKTVCNGCSGRLVDDTENIQASDETGILCNSS